MKRQALFRGIVTELDKGEFFSDVAVKFKNIEVRMVVPRSTIDEYGIKVGDKVYVMIENQNVFLFKR
ncbi:AbrB/MazE/SpoVT family DNA-binding domain-containing protein [Hydrogenobacter sp. T-2]|uniref:AbrB/MazE/SpoVT family DNA-binding domain-containing protein n=1 Tax=Pampinifervens diazotrophicum TaxID=1632018 RepID=UPI002B2605DF|nr:AbrB/MazE/SpoVT family DNA-binding domain-containing protein [Hydrogenobacter sp. T-2]WPM31470.1 AbrB/MazE/SpoVT family DNA-binding domain-containing protein [Hydrogenobacter sp. T-2]